MSVAWGTTWYVWWILVSLLASALIVPLLLAGTARREPGAAP